MTAPIWASDGSDNIMQFLTEKRLKDLVKFVFSNTEIKFNQKIGKFKPDIFLSEHKLIIEFDGYRHFFIVKNTLRDIALDRFASREKLNIVHIPYFVQIDGNTYPAIFNKYRELDEEITQFLKSYRYPHGFIDSKAMLPADYCSIGIQRFEFMIDYYSVVRDKIIKSLDNQITNGKDIFEVYPIGIYKKFH